MAWHDFSWRKATPLQKRLIVSAGIVVLVVGGYEAGRSGSAPSTPASQSASSERASQPPPTDGTGPLQTASTDPGPVPLTQLSSGPCRTFAPEGWKITDQNKDGTVLTVTSADGALTAAYGAMAINAGQVQGLYGPQFTSPEAISAYLIKALVNEDARLEGEAETIGSYQATKFTTASHAGYVLTYRFPLAADPGGFGLILRIAIGKAGDPHSVGVAGAAAAATRCNAQLHPSEGPVYHAPSSTAHGADNAGGSDNDLAGTYNAQLGTGWVHDAGTGQNYNVDVTRDWNANGPDGPGYYKPNGTKLVPGMSN